MRREKKLCTALQRQKNILPGRFLEKEAFLLIRNQPPTLPQKLNGWRLGGKIQQFTGFKLFRQVIHFGKDHNIILPNQFDVLPRNSFHSEMWRGYTHLNIFFGGVEGNSNHITRSVTNVNEHIGFIISQPL